MAQVSVTIAGHVYRMACAEGEEPHLQDLAEKFDGRIMTLKQSFGEIGDQRLTVMAAITVADELVEAQQRIASLEAELAELRSDASLLLNGRDEWADRLAESLDDVASRIERVAHGLNNSGRG